MLGSCDSVIEYLLLLRLKLLSLSFGLEGGKRRGVNTPGSSRGIVSRGLVVG